MNTKKKCNACCRVDAAAEAESRTPIEGRISVYQLWQYEAHVALVMKNYSSGVVISRDGVPIQPEGSSMGSCMFCNSPVHAGWCGCSRVPGYPAP